MSDPFALNTNEVRIAAIRQYVTIFELLERIGIDLTPQTQQIHCPFHKDVNPSARVFEGQNKIYCWTCQRGWDVVDAAQSHLNVGLGEALIWLEQEFAVPGGTMGLTGTIRTRLSARAAPDIKEAADLVEQTLKSKRQQLGYTRYTKLLQGLDLSVWEYTERKIKADVVRERFAQLMGAAR